MWSNPGIDSDDMKLELDGESDLWKEWATFSDEVLSQEEPLATGDKLPGQ